MKRSVALAFRDLPIRHKFTLVFVTTSAVALLLSSIAFATFEFVSFRRQMVQTISTQATLIGYNSASALLFNDPKAAETTLTALRAEPHVIAAGIYGKTGDAFALYVRNRGPVPPDLSSTVEDARRQFVFRGQYLLVWRDIEVGDEVIGSVRVLSDTEALREMFGRYSFLIGVVFIVSLLASLPILRRLQRVISGPIMHLVEKARIVSSERDYSIRAVRTSGDELGLLVGTFNEMLTHIQQRETDLETARDNAEAANRTKDEFLAVVSHELRTPLTPILAWARLLRDRNLDAAQQERALDIIERNAKSQAQIIEDLLDVSRIVTGKLRLDVQQIDIVPVVESAIDSMRPTADLKGVGLGSTIDPRSGFVSGDSERLKQVVWNLLSNAIKFTPKGGRVRVVVQRVNSHLEIVVSDTGQGIAPEFVAHAFERFRQADSTSTRLYGGLGVGLAIVRHLVEMHGGRVRAESPGVGGGATFSVELPIAAVPASTVERVHPAASKQLPTSAVGPSLEGLSILVVDDDEDTLQTLRILLSQRGATVETASSSQGALETLDKWLPDIVISDIGMPHEDGYDFIRHLRARPLATGGRIPALALTAYARVEDRLQVLAAGYQMHIPKPVEPAELIAVLASLAEWAPRQADHGNG